VAVSWTAGLGDIISGDLLYHLKRPTLNLPSQVGVHEYERGKECVSAEEKSEYLAQLNLCRTVLTLVERADNEFDPTPREVPTEHVAETDEHEGDKADW